MTLNPQGFVFSNDSIVPENWVQIGWVVSERARWIYKKEKKLGKIIQVLLLRTGPDRKYNFFRNLNEYFNFVLHLNLSEEASN